MSAVIRCYHEAKACRIAFRLQQRIYALSRHWPREEANSLTARVLRSAGAISADLAHAWTRRPEPAEFTTRLCLVEAEIAETLHWLETAHSCGYLQDEHYRSLREECRSLGKMLTAMVRASQKIPECSEPAHVPRCVGDAS